jgi:hypothetical protein
MIVWSLGTFDLLVGVLFGRVAHIGTHGSAYGSIAAIAAGSVVTRARWPWFLRRDADAENF